MDMRKVTLMRVMKHDVCWLVRECWDVLVIAGSLLAVLEYAVASM